MPDDVSAELRAALVADPLAQLLGIDLEVLQVGYARASMVVHDALLNPVGTGHGGAVMALIDVIHAAVSNSHGTLAVAQDVHTEFLATVRAGDRVVCEGREVHRSNRTAVYQIDVRADGLKTEGQRLVATALARVFRLGTPWLESSADS